MFDRLGTATAQPTPASAPTGEAQASPAGALRGARRVPTWQAGLAGLGGYLGSCAEECMAA